MVASTRVLYLFLASPGDLASERKATRDTIIEVNQQVGRNLGWQIEVLGWEDTLPGFLRPQDMINRDVDRCDLFVGMLWKRWGQPTGDGKHSSGFEEEYRRAVNRRRYGHLPEVWLFFKEIDDGTKEDPGPQVEKVLQFRDNVIRAKRPYFQEFKDIDDWKGLLRSRLIDFLFEQHSTFPDAPDGGAAPSRRSAHIAEPALELPGPSTAAQDQAVDCLDEIISNVKVGGLETAGIDGISGKATARFMLVASAISRGLDDDQLLGIRESNRVYIFRESIIPTLHERQQLIRSALADPNSYIPFFWWIQAQTEGDIMASLLGFAVHDGNDRVCSGALRVLRQADASVSANQAQEIFQSCERKGGDSLLQEAFKFSGKFASEGLAKSIFQYQGSTNTFVRAAALDAWLSVLTRSGIARLAEELLALDSDIEIPRVVLSNAQLLEVPLEIWRHAALHKNERVRNVGARGLVAYGERPRHLERDSSVETRELVLRARIAAREVSSEDEITAAYSNVKGGVLSGYIYDQSETTRLYYQTLKYEDLVEKSAWYGVQSADAYRVLAHNHFDKFGSEVINDLGDDFVQRRLLGRSRSASRWGGEGAVDSVFRSSEDFYRELHISAALSAVRKWKPKLAVTYARKYMGPSRYGVGREVALILMSSGVGEDLDRVRQLGSDVAGWSDSDIADALKSNDDVKDLCFDERISPHLRAKLIENAPPSILEGEDAQLAQALRVKDDGPRKALARRLGVGIGASRCSAVLREYTAGGNYYYYDVTRILDAASYSPPPWQKSLAAARGELEYS